MSVLTVFFALVFYAATVVLIGGLAYKVWRFFITPAPLKIPTTPAPTTRAGTIFRLAKEVAIFESLFRSTKWTWAFGILFHISLALVLLRHVPYFTEPVPDLVVLAQPFGLYAAFTMVLGLFGLWARRLFIDRIFYISQPMDHLMLLLLVAIGLTGLGMDFVARTDIIQLKAFFLGLMMFEWQALPDDTFLVVHITLVAILMFIFPFTKLLHGPALLFSPSRYQIDNPREKRHLAPWAAAMEAAPTAESAAGGQ